MQVFIFLTCALCGVLSGVVYDVLYIARVFVCGTNRAKYTVKDKIFICLCDIIYFLALSAAFVFISLCFEFYAIRLYMIVGCALGSLIYLKSIHLIIAYFVNMLYNKVAKAKKSERKRLWAKKNATKSQRR